MRTWRKTQGLGPTLIPPLLEISVAHANFAPTLVGLFSVLLGRILSRMDT